MHSNLQTTPTATAHHVINCATYVHINIVFYENKKILQLDSRGHCVMMGIV